MIKKMFAASIRWEFQGSLQCFQICRGGYVEVLLGKKKAEVWKNCLSAEVVDVWKLMTQER